MDIQENKIECCLCDIKFELKEYFQSPGVLKDTLENIAKLSSLKNRSHFINAELWQSKVRKYPNKVLFPIFLYFDAFQINDALGSHTKSIEGIYYTIPVVPQHHLAHLNNIFLAGFINSEDLKNFGNQLTLQRLITNLKDLSENGIEINYNKENIKIF